MGRPREHDDATRRRLLRAAEDLLTETNTAAPSVRAIAEAAETTTRAVYSVFGSRSGLLAALATELFDELAAAIDAVPLTDDPVDDLVTASVSGFRTVMLAHRPVFTLVFRDVVPDVDLDALRAGGAAFDRLEARVARILPPSADERTVRDAALAFHSLTEGLAATELRGGLGEPRAAKRIWTRAIRALADGWS